MVRALLAKISVANEKVHRIAWHVGAPLEAAERYEKELKAFYGAIVVFKEAGLASSADMASSASSRLTSRYEDSNACIRVPGRDLAHAP
jgi:hypothetical protein